MQLSKFQLGLIVIAAIILFWIVLSMTNNYIPQTKEVPKISDLVDTNASCQPTSTGWKCRFNVPNEREPPREWNNNTLITSYRNACEEQGGKWKCYGFCMPQYDHYCDFKYADAGELCISNLQCGSACIGTIGIGTCAEYPLRICDWYQDLLFIIPTFKPQVLCD